jgi:GrpB-like predicted nucleotidyltransferase (UPF0157 family)
MNHTHEPFSAIEAYEHHDAVCVEHDPATAEVAAHVAHLLRARMPSLRVEHVGSTAVPGCAGKGIVDIAVLYPAGELAAARALVDSLGLQRQPQREPFPEERPMRVGALRRAGRTYYLHVHVVSADAVEAANLLGFRDRLRSDPALRDAYVALKRAVLAAGVTDSLAFSYAKSEFIRARLPDR